MKWILSVIVSIVFFAACYKVPDGTPPAVSPGYNMYIYDYQTIDDTSYVFQIRDSSTYTLPLHFRIISGDALGYPLICSIENPPTGISVAEAPVTFRLNYDLSFHLTALTDVPVGFYHFNIKVAVAGSSPIYYPIRLQVFAH